MLPVIWAPGSPGEIFNGYARSSRPNPSNGPAPTCHSGSSWCRYRALAQVRGIRCFFGRDYRDPYFDRAHQPVLMEFGPVLALDDVLGGKVAALASRAVERDYIDVAAALARGYSVAQLTGLAVALDPGLTAEDFADAGQRLDRLGADRFARYGLTPEDVTRLREQFAAWPRTPDAVPGTPGSGVADPAQGFPLGREHPA
jgi:hypothetical protein